MWPLPAQALLRQVQDAAFGTYPEVVAPANVARIVRTLPETDVCNELAASAAGKEELYTGGC